MSDERIVPRYSPATNGLGDTIGGLTSADGPPAPTTIKTASGRYFDLAAPTPDQVFLGDIADHLAKLNRFTGATGVPYSVAQHSVYVSHVVVELGCPEAAPYGLMHDGEEAYTNDWATPMKRTFAAFGAGDITHTIADNIRRCVMHRLGLRWPAPPDLWEVVKRADAIAFVTERRDLMPGDEHLSDAFRHIVPRNHRIVVWPWDKAAREFRSRALDLGLAERGI